MEIPFGLEDQVIGAQHEISHYDAQGKEKSERGRPIPHSAGKSSVFDGNPAKKAPQGEALRQGGDQASKAEIQVPETFAS